MQKRKYYKNIWADFNKEKEMILISGARQAGKTTLAKDTASEEPVSHYFNYAGRYLHFHLFPFTVGEISSSTIRQVAPEILLEVPERNNLAREFWETTFQVSGFPEPCLKGTKLKYRRWAHSYHSQVIRDDIRNEFAVRHIDTMEALYALITNCVGSPFSASNQAAILKISHNTVSTWITVFEQFFLVFKLRPHSKRISRSLVKEPKIYFYDYCRLQEEALRFENMVAVELNRAVTLWTDFGFGEYQLWFLRNKEKQEVDFLVTENDQPLFMVEAKFPDAAISPNLIFVSDFDIRVSYFLRLHMFLPGSLESFRVHHWKWWFNVGINAGEKDK
ncbi:MAG: ATP-binding protein [Deltaproteobacteria bacterium]|nr:ATP-binding protein [Deltaproteobacteria bacterium]